MTMTGYEARTTTGEAAMKHVAEATGDPSLACSIREGRLPVDPTLAEFVLSEMRYKGQRPCRAPHVEYLATLMSRALWTPASQIAFGLMPDGTLHLVNGQHRLRAVVESGTTQTFQVAVIDVDDEEDLAKLYASYDTGMRTRSNAELLNARGVAESQGVSRTMVSSVMEAVAILANGLRSPRPNVDPVMTRSLQNRIELAEQWWPYVKTLEVLLKPARKPMRQNLRGGGTVAVALATIRYQPKKAEPFWGGMAEDDKLGKTDPRWALSRTLAERTMSRGSVDTRIIVPCLAWNAWYEGRNIGRLNVMPGSVPKLLGTPYTGREGRMR